MVISIAILYCIGHLFLSEIVSFYDFRYRCSGQPRRSLDTDKFKLILLHVLICFLISGGAKPKSVEQPYLIGIVVTFVQKFLPRFKDTDIIYVRSMRASKTAVLNVQCRSVVVAGLVKSTFAGLVKQTTTPDYIGNVGHFNVIR